MYSDTIAAIATPPGEGGIGTVRLSGPHAEGILRSLFRRGGAPLDRFESHRLVYGDIHDPATGEKVDEALVVIMRAPHSYTREEVAEIDCHGGPVPLHRVMRLCLDQGARIAEPGEFTLRAFLNGRIDLAQAEAVLDVVRARTGEGLELALDQLGGGLSARVRGLRQKVLHSLAHIEATIDFPEDDVPPADVTPDLEGIRKELEALIASAAGGIVMRQGLRTAIVGRPNVGKSSLLNALLKTDRAIVTPIPGTTRDTLEEVVNVRGVPLVLTDTAGLRGDGAEDAVERIGIERTHRAVGNADLVMLVFDGSEALTEADRQVIAGVAASAPRTRLAVVNKTDLARELDRQTLSTALGPDVQIVEASATAEGGTSALEETLAGLVLSGRAVARGDEAVVTSERHRDALRRAEEHVAASLASATAGVPAAFVAVDLRAALNDLGEITGETATEDILDEIFRNFCIGK